jgi:hypothetical protein
VCLEDGQRGQAAQCRGQRACKGWGGQAKTGRARSGLTILTPALLLASCHVPQHAVLPHTAHSGTALTCELVPLKVQLGQLWGLPVSRQRPAQSIVAQKQQLETALPSQACKRAGKQRWCSTAGWQAKAAKHSGKHQWHCCCKQQRVAAVGSLRLPPAGTLPVRLLCRSRSTSSPSRLPQCSGMLPLQPRRAGGGRWQTGCCIITNGTRQAKAGGAPGSGQQQPTNQAATQLKQQQDAARQSVPADGSQRKHKQQRQSHTHLRLLNSR